MEIKDRSFEENILELEKIVKELENGEIPLSDSIDKFNEGMKIANECNKILENANEVVTKILNKENKLEKFNIDE